MGTASETWPSGTGGLSGAARSGWVSGRRRRAVGQPHITLLVANPSASADWWCRTFGFVPVGPPDSLVTSSTALIRHPDTGLVVGFRRRPAGLPAKFEYFSLRVSSVRALEDWAAHLERVGIAHSPVWGTSDERYLSFIAPDGVGVELWWARPS